MRKLNVIKKIQNFYPCLNMALKALVKSQFHPPQEISKRKRERKCRNFATYTKSVNFRIQN